MSSSLFSGLFLSVFIYVHQEYKGVDMVRFDINKYHFIEISLHDNAHHILDFIAQGKRSFNTWNCKSLLPVSLFKTHIADICFWIACGLNSAKTEEKIWNMMFEVFLVFLNCGFQHFAHVYGKEFHNARKICLVMWDLIFLWWRIIHHYLDSYWAVG